MGTNLAAPVVAILATGFAVGCDVDGRPHLQNWDGSDLLPAEVLDLDQADPRPALLAADAVEPWLGELAAPDPSSVSGGGATLTFAGTGGPVCVLVDPQTVWRDDYLFTGAYDPSWENYVYDDGDIELLVGLAADYTGTPGVEMGSFESVYVDPLGVERTADLNLCAQPDINGYPGGHAGRATPEYCTISTQAEVTYLVVLQTYAVPVDDNRLKYALALIETDCGELGSIHECTLRGDADPSSDLEDVGGDFEAKYCGGAGN